LFSVLKKRKILRFRLFPYFSTTKPPNPDFWIELFWTPSLEIGRLIIKQDFVCCCVCEISENLWFLVSVCCFIEQKQKVTDETEKHY